MVSDPRQAEAFFFIALILILLVLFVAQYTAWFFLQDTIEAHPDGTVALTFWLIQVGAVLGFFGGCLLGFRPALTVTVTEEGLVLQQGREMLRLIFSEVQTVEPLSPLVFHRHYARYAATRVFIARLTPTLMLLQTPEGPVVLGLLPQDHTALLKFLHYRLNEQDDMVLAENYGE